MAVIESVYARQILDSRGNPTVEVVLDTDDGAQCLSERIGAVLIIV